MQNHPPIILSNTPLSDWRGSLTTFNGFTSTQPDQEFKDLTWQKISKQACPDKPTIITDKRQALYFLPCVLSAAPLVGNTLEAAIKNGRPPIGKMRSKSHVTEASMLIIDIDGIFETDLIVALDKIANDGVTYLGYTTHSNGDPAKPGMRVRLIIPVDHLLNIGEYAAAWHGFDKHYLDGQAGMADPSGANLYQAQGTWCSHPDRIDQAQSWANDDGVASAKVLIEIGQSAQSQHPVEKVSVAQLTISNKDYPPSDANRIADSCQQIKVFRDSKGAEQAEPLWRDCLGVVGFCENGETICQEWSCGYKGYDAIQTAKKLSDRMKMPPTTCAQFRKSNSSGCQDCMQKCNSPIKLGWPDTFENSKTSDNNAGVISPTDDEVIASLAAMPPMEYDRVRLEKAKELGIQRKTLDDLVKAARNEEKKTNQVLFPELEPYPEPIDLAVLLNEISEIIRRFVVLDAEQTDTAALWISHTYLIDVFDTSPIAIINAPERVCAKTLFQTLLARLSYRPLPAANASTSALFRSVESLKPTIFLDEADTFFKKNPELQGLVNAGYKRGGFVLRSESTGESFEPRMFSVYCAKSIAGIALEKHLPNSTMSRGIIFNLQRKLEHEKVTRFRNAENQAFEVITSKLTRFAFDYSKQIRLASPSLPEELSDRGQDNWEPLLAIAECAGAEWLKRATTAALKLSNTGETSMSISNELLADIRDIFESKRVEKISTVDLIEALAADDESPWATYNRGKPFTPRQLAKLLAGYGIQSKTVRLGHKNTPKGFDAGQFADIFARYLPSKLPQQRNDSPEANNDEAGRVADKTQHFRNDYVSLEPFPGKDCSDVSNQTTSEDF